MKNAFLFIALFALGMTSCETDDMGGTPLITVDSVQVNGETVRYCDIYSQISVPVNAIVRVFTTLEAYDGTLKSFNTEIKCYENDEIEDVAHQKEIKYEEGDVSSELTNLPEGTLRFKDGVVKTNVAVETVTSSKMKDDALTFKFFLNTDDKAAKAELLFKVVDEDEED